MVQIVLNLTLEQELDFTCFDRVLTDGFSSRNSENAAWIPEDSRGNDSRAPKAAGMLMINNYAPVHTLHNDKTIHYPRKTQRHHWLV